MQRMNQTVVVCLTLFLLSAVQAQSFGPEDLRRQVEDTERAFARTMAERDFDAFKAFLSDEAIFFAGETPLRGKQEVAAVWEAFYEGEEAPFSWAPETVAVLDTGSLALSSGPVRGPDGNRVATFHSIWRLDPDGTWRIVFDKGSRYCQPPAAVAQD